MDIFSREIPRYMVERSNLTRLVIFTAGFALLFINLYKPFSSGGWYPVSGFMFFVFSSLIILTGVVVVVVSRVLMYFRARRHAITHGQYAAWIAAEIFFMALFYTIYTLSINEGERDAWHTFRESVVNTSLVLLLPYAMLLLYFSRRDKERQLQRVEEQGARGNGDRPPLLSFRDEKGDERLSVSRPALLYLESSDNYVVISYLNKGAVTRFLLRNTLKALEAPLAPHDVLRCHRSFMVNLEHVKVIRRDKEGISLELGVEKVPDIPVSKTYGDKIARWFARYSS
ncbi:MAG: LytTR family transcriptional regulator [Odoribacteraceae bacterium]|nr:LytTR family transcriptional regulator [Odoribacteraceae bacterium]